MGEIQSGIKLNTKVPLVLRAHQGQVSADALSWAGNMALAIVVGVPRAGSVLADLPVFCCCPFLSLHFAT